VGNVCRNSTLVRRPICLDLFGRRPLFKRVTWLKGMCSELFSDVGGHVAAQEPG